VWAPDERDEAVRISPALGRRPKDLQGKRQQISSLMLRLERVYPNADAGAAAATKVALWR